MYDNEIFYDSVWFLKENKENLNYQPPNYQKEFPFIVKCRSCNSKKVTISAYNYNCLEFRCSNCGRVINCKRY